MRPFFKTLSILAITLFLVSACAPIKSPERFTTLGEIYPPASVMNISTDVPPDATKKGFFEAPFEDVFQAVKVGATQAQFNIEKIDNDNGIILATRVLQIRNRGGAGGNATRVYSYAILVKEVSAESTQVTVLAKLQDTCFRESEGQWAAVSCLTFGIAAPTAAIAIPMEKKACAKASSVRWASDAENSLQEMGQLITFVRNNLIAAGVL